MSPSHHVAHPITLLSRRRLLAASGVGLALGAPRFARAAQPGATPAIASPAAESNGRLVDIGGRSLYMEIAGEGEPTVILEAGAGSRGDVWNRDQLFPAGERQMVFPAVAGFTRVLLYDRPGTIGEVNSSLDPTAPLFYPSRSDPAPQPRTIADFVADLHALLAAAEIPPPYVLVGHSMGGMAMRLFANTYPDEVVGMVLVDATGEYVHAAFAEILTPEQWDTFEALTLDRTDLLDAYPDAEQLLQAPLDAEPSAMLLREAQARSPLRDMPLFVLSHGIPFGAPFPGWPVDEAEAAMNESQQHTTELVPNARQVIAEKSGHNIHQDQPDLVIEAIRQVVDAVRDPATWASD